MHLNKKKKSQLKTKIIFIYLGLLQIENAHYRL